MQRAQGPTGTFWPFFLIHQVPTTSQICQAAMLQRGCSKSEQALVPTQALIILIPLPFSISTSVKFLTVMKAVDEVHSLRDFMQD